MISDMQYVCQADFSLHVHLHYDTISVVGDGSPHSSPPRPGWLTEGLPGRFFVAHLPGICYNVKWIFIFGVRTMKIRQMTDVEKRAAAKAFVEAWTGRGDEKQDAQNFWRMLLSTVYGVEDPESSVSFEFRA